MDPRDADEILKIIENAIHQVYEHNATSLSLDDLYSNASHMVQNNFGQKLYSGIVSTMTSHIKEMTRSIEQVSNGEPLFLEELSEKWTKHNKAFQILRRIFMCMDASCIPSKHKAHVQELGASLWVDNVIYSSNIKGKLTLPLIDMVQAEREDEVINRDLLKSILKMLMELGDSVYQEVFEKPFIQISRCLYIPESEDLIEHYDCEYYLKITEKRLNEEMERVSDYFDVEHALAAKSLVKIINVLEDLMITSHMSRLVDSGLVSMIVDNKYDDLARMYNLFRRVPNGLMLIRDAMTCHVRETVKQLVTNSERLKDPVAFVQRLLDEKDKHEKIIHLAFNDDVGFQKALNSLFEYLINLNPRVPEFISLFVDDTLRKRVNEDNMEILLDKVMGFISYLNKKDVFERYYEQHMAKRLLSGVGKNVSEDAEKRMISKLKKQCGFQFTSKLEGMLSDMEDLTG